MKGPYDTTSQAISNSIYDIENFVYDMSRCIKCKGCTWVDHTYMPGPKFDAMPQRCKCEFDAYGA
jgi:NADH dehydrogenase/NADH:ubiquinone oxidoreductase subunit G